ncbi:uncharacterized protein LOC127651377 [Xyrauchen texanus]|uniref:uncharacterized protein LOC127651377 n=1 Tax=Xyrauchen texanus TaxID=154827 RepID=UPI002242412B|nr:uncharacterized protein LOC127651377 [Xyrauchen texanus]
MVSLGLKSERSAKLLPTAVPSVNANLSACPVPRSRDTVCRKQEIATMLTDASQQETVDSVDTVESVDTGDQPLPSSTSDAGTQCSLKPPRWSHEELMGLFVICPACCERSDSSIVQQEGTFLKIKQVCASCGYHRFWQNQPMLHRNMPTCNLLLSGAIHFTGCLATQTLRMLTLFGLQCISASSYFRHQHRYTIPVIVQAWQNDQAKNFSDLRAMDGGLVLAGDCRSDSPGHCAKYGSYSLIEDRVNKVVDVQLVQSSEVPNSSWCELEGLKRSVGLLRERTCI